MTFFYPDISNVGNRGLALQSGTVVVCAKATEAEDFKDPSYVGFRSQAEHLGAHFFAYHWTWCESPQAEAQNAFSMVGPNTPIMWDVENTHRVQTVAGILDLTDRYRKLGGHAALVYLPHWYWQNNMHSPDLTPLTAAGLRLVSSNYTGYADDGPGWATYGGVEPYVWQYTNAKPYSGQRVDFNACRDTLTGFVDKLWPGSIPVPTPQNGDDMLTHWVTVKSGSTGSGVKVAQGLLLAHGYTVGSRNGLPDGDFGPATTGATRALQENFHIGVDGEFGPHTLSVALYGHDFA